MLVALGLAAVLLGRTPVGDWVSARLGGDEGPPAIVLPVADVQELDPPPGDGAERPDRLFAVADGDPTTSWATETYRSRDLGGRKDGVGLVLVLPGRAALAELLVRSPTQGWGAEVYVADGPATDLAGWGEPVAGRADIGGDGRFDLGGRDGAAVLVWITDLGEGAPEARVEVSDAVVSGMPR